MKTTLKTLIPIVMTKEEMGELAGEIASLQNRINALTTAQNEALDLVRKEFAPQFATLQSELEDKTERALDWCQRNEATEFATARTIFFPRADVQFRRGNFEVKYRSKWTVLRIVAALKLFITKGKPPGTKYIRIVEEVNKEAVIQDRDEFTPDEWFALGMRIVQGKSMIITGKGDPVENATQEKAA